MQRLRMLAISAAICCLAVPAEAQFKFEKIKPNFGFEPVKQITYYSRSRFNRIEGVYLNFGAKVMPRRFHGVTVFADGGYGFKNDAGRRWRYRLELRKNFQLPNQFTLGLRYFDEVFSNDNWLISETENSLAAIFGHNDFMDFHGRKGGMVYADYKFKQVHTLRLEVARYEYEVMSVKPNTEWSLFARGKDYPANPHFAPAFAFFPGSETTVRAMAALDFRDNPIFPLIGWYVEGILEQTFDDFETSGLFLTLKRFQPTWGSQRLKAKALFGTRSGSFAYQHMMTLGGLGSLRGFPHKQFVGNRLLFATLQYQFGGDILQRVPLDFIPFWEALSLGVFVDTGLAWLADPADAGAGLFDFGDFSLSDFKTDFGLSLIFTEGLLRLDLARRTDIGDPAWELYFRLLDKF